MNEQILDMIRAWLQPELERRNLFLVDLKSSGGKKYEVFIDGENNVTIDECAEVSRYLEKLLDEEGSVPEDYNLEVSSPGMGNPLKVPQQYKKRIGRVLDIWLEEDKIEALLVESDDQGITVRELVKEKSKSKNKSKKKEIITREEEMKIPYTDIKKALLQFNF
jgi:ribosome maturation factor RimP